MIRWYSWGLIVISVCSLLVSILSAHAKGEINTLSGVLMASVGLLECFILFKIGQLKNWARRLYIVVYLLLLSFLPYFISKFSKELLSLNSSTLSIMEASLSVFFSIMETMFIIILFQRNIRSYFTPVPPKIYQRVMLLMLAFLSFLISPSIYFALKDQGRHMQSNQSLQRTAPR